jgi:hypothetical protein
MAIRPPLHVEVMDVAISSLPWPVSGRMAIHASFMHNHFHHDIKGSVRQLQAPDFGFLMVCKGNSYPRKGQKQQDGKGESFSHNDRW